MSKRYKMHHFLAIPNRNPGRVPVAMFDMLRYDSCYPCSNAPDGWVVLVQPYREGVTGGFTFGRWESFGFKVMQTAVGDYLSNIPSDLINKCRQFDAANPRTKNPEWATTESVALKHHAKNESITYCGIYANLLAHHEVAESPAEVTCTLCRQAVEAA